MSEYVWDQAHPAFVGPNIAWRRWQGRGIKGVHSVRTVGGNSTYTERLIFAAKGPCDTVYEDVAFQEMFILGCRLLHAK